MRTQSAPLNISILGCGWLGLPLLRALVADGHRVKGSSRNPKTLAAIKAAGGEAFHLDLPGEVPREFIGGLTCVLIITLPPRGRALGEAAVAHYLACLRSIPKLQSRSAPEVIFTSSTGVYGKAEGLVTELSPTQPDTHSSRAVLAAEEWLATTATEHTILRLAGLVAEDRHPGRFYGGRRRPIPQADAPINLVHRDDVISAIKLLLRRMRRREVYNVCAAAHPPKGRFYERAAASLGLDVAGLQAGGANGKTIVSDKLREIGWEPKQDTLTDFL